MVNGLLLSLYPFIPYLKKNTLKGYQEGIRGHQGIQRVYS